MKKLASLSLGKTSSMGLAHQVIRGQGAIYNSFSKERPCDLWCWNVNGIKAVMEKGYF